MPLRIASRGLPIATGRPSSRIDPASAGAMPNSASATSVRPAPMSPDMPRISPRRSAKDTSRKAPVRHRPSTASTVGPSGWGERLNSESSGRPTIAWTRRAGVKASVGSVQTWRPSRSTVMRSQSANTSSRRCEM